MQTEQVSIWEASDERKQSSNMFHFLQFLQSKYKQDFTKAPYRELHRWSVQEAGQFWTSLVEFSEAVVEGPLSPPYAGRDFLHHTWFPEVRLNFAENLLRKAKTEEGARKAAIKFIHESGLKSAMTYGELNEQVGKLQRALAPHLKGDGDVLAAYMPNLPQTVVSMLAVAGLGGIFTSTSCDFGAQGVVDRFGQTSPKVLVAATGYMYNGTYFDQTEKIREVQRNLPTLEKVILVDFLGRLEVPAWEGTVLWSELMRSAPSETIFRRKPFSSPLYILYSSGTTGKPKCIVHSAGGTLLQHIKELGLHSDLKEGKNILYFTTCGWMMWNWQVTSLFFGATVHLYEGSPAYPGLGILPKLINEEKINLFGTSPKFLRALELALIGGEATLPGDLPSLETLLCTGSPLLPEQFDFVYGKFKKDLHLASICGGTDIIGCFMLGNPLLPVYRGEIQCLGLGMDVAAFSEEGREVIGTEGELVCRQTFPSVPVGFWGDGPNHELFRHAYFERFPGVWHHGDFIKISAEGTVKVFGRSDATLNPGGVRIGTAEIYQQLEKLAYVYDGLCVGRDKDKGEDVEIILFIKMRGRQRLTDERIKEIKTIIRSQTTPRHVPGAIYEVKDIPYTRSGKKMELLVAHLLNGRPITNMGAVINPECLEEYRRFI